MPDPLPATIPDTASLTLLLNTPSDLDRQELEQGFIWMQDLLFDQLGVICPKVEIQTSAEIPDHSFQLQINELRLDPTPALEPDEFWVNCPAALLAENDIPGRPSTNPNTGEEAAIVRGDEEMVAKWQSAGFETRSPLVYLVANVATMIRAHAGMLLSSELLQYYLMTLRENYAALVDATLAQFDHAALIQMLREQLEQQRSIKNLPGTLEDLLAQTVAQPMASPAPSDR